MNLDDLRALRDKLEPHSYGIGGIQVKIPFGTDDLCLTVYPSTDEKQRAVEEILEPYRDKFLRIDILRSYDPSLAHSYLDRIDFFALKDSMARVIEAQIRRIVSDYDGEPFYAFVVGISPAHYSFDTSVNTESAWATRKAYYLEKGSGVDTGLKFWSPEFTAEYPRAEEDTFDDLYAILGQMEEVSDEYYSLTQETTSFYQLVERRFTQMATHALKANFEALEGLRKTEDFVAYVQDYTGSGDDIYTELETVPLRRLKEMYPEAFARTQPKENKSLDTKT